ncbi:MAG TPA: 1,6-anhydro-N-acetylmuramyl-L-alanine amidase AmpD [Steroidobacter sp.]|jgi:AmpD protein|nr:1,6-anhydro-N-acetylmuramyl-L-alanine amidase AmpD [Steroidobacter sp.]
MHASKESKHCAGGVQNANCRAMRVRSSGSAIDPTSGWLTRARRVPSPNFDDRPAGASPDLIVVHGISLPPGEFGGIWIDRLFTNTLPPDAHPYFAQVASLTVSSHVLIRRDGEIVQYVPFHRRAWHAGQSNYRGRERCNDFSIGLELEGTDGSAYEPAQYRALSELILELCEAYSSLSPERVVGHSDIAPGRKTDPGPAFDWPRLRALLRLGVQ